MNKECSICGKKCITYVWTSSIQVSDRYRCWNNDTVICMDCYKNIEPVYRPDRACPDCHSTRMGEVELLDEEDEPMIEIYCALCGRMLRYVKKDGTEIPGDGVEW